MKTQKIYEISRQITKSFLNSIGFDLIRTSKLAQHNLCGLKNISFKTIIDVGANTGQFARSIINHFPTANFICIEPLPEPYTTLQEWASGTRGKVQTLNMAIGDQDGEVPMYFHSNFSPSSSLLASTNLNKTMYPFTEKQGIVTVRQLTLDHALKNVQLETEILIKLDVQGFEDRVLKGGKYIFSQAAACIIEVSLDNMYEGQADFRQLFTQLDQMDYRYVGNLSQVFAKDGHVIYFDAVFLRNYLQMTDGNNI